ncbi:MAG: ferritin-like domain-containing protein [Solirubrobacterales bacterium]
MSRRKLMALTGGSTAMAAFLAAYGSDSGTTTSTAIQGGSGTSDTAQFGKGDIGILNYALTLEHLEAAFYSDLAKSGLFKGAELETIRKFDSEEAQQVASIVQVEARHAAAIRLQNERSPVPVVFYPALEVAQVLKAVEAFIA